MGIHKKVLDFYGIASLIIGIPILALSGLVIISFLTMPEASEQDMYDTSDIYIVHLVHNHTESNMSYYGLQDYNKKLFNGDRFTFVTNLEGPEKFSLYVIEDRLVFIENKKLNLLLEERGID